MIKYLDNGPVVVISNQLTMFDIDDTLLYWDSEKVRNQFQEAGKPLPRTVKFQVGSCIVEKYVIEPHVKELILQKESGATIVVWSASGHVWAEAVVKALGIEEYVDIISSKPVRIYDDKDPEFWMPKRRYFVE